jgi:hypothetical protein
VFVSLGGVSRGELPTASLKGLRVYLAEGDGEPVKIPRKVRHAIPSPAEMLHKGTDRARKIIQHLQ